jgi:lipoate-protein ligase B
MSFEKVLSLQDQWVNRVQKHAEESVLLWSEPISPVLTLGRATRPQHWGRAQSWLEQQGIEVISVDRGGSVTWHGPGQWLGYVIMDLRPRVWTLHETLRQLEQAWMDCLQDFGLDARRILGRTGIWVGEDKLISIGIGVRHWVTYHGFAINVNPDMEAFERIVPCGLEGVRMTSLKQLGVGDPCGLKPAFERDWRQALEQSPSETARD